MGKAFAFSRSFISSTSSSNSNVLGKRRKNICVFTCLFNPSRKVKELIKFLKTRVLSRGRAKVNCAFHTLQIWLYIKKQLTLE